MRRLAPHQLWIGHIGDAGDARALSASGILALVHLALEEPAGQVPRDMVQLRFPLEDGAGNPDWLLRAAIDAVAGLARSGTPTLVFCSAGMSRSPAIAAAALSKATGDAPSDLLRDVVRDAPADVSPHLWAAVLRVLAAAP